MTRKLTFLLMALMALTGLRCWGQSDIFTEGFENVDATGIPAGWIVKDNDGDSFNWHATINGDEGNAHSGLKVCYSFKYCYSQTENVVLDNYLITPQLDLGKHATMRFWMKPEQGEKFGVAISTTGTEISDFQTIKNWTSTSDGIVWGEYKEYTIDLSAYANQNVYIAFRHFNTYGSLSGGGPKVYLDDITVFLGKTAPIAVDFESGAIPSGWTTIDNDGDECNWQITTEKTHGGSYALVSCMSFPIDADYDVDNILVSPQLDLGRNAKMEFFAAPDYHEVFGVYASTTSNTNPDDFTIIQQWTSQNLTHSFDKYEADLSEYAGQKVYLAIRHINTYDDWNPEEPVSKIYLDDITIDLGDYEQNCHNVFVTQPTVGGQISATPYIYVPQNTYVSLTATPEYGYGLDQWTIEPEVQHNQHGFFMPDNDVTVTATFKELDQYFISFVNYDPEKITVKATYNGEEIYKAPVGTVVTLEHTMLDESYELKYWTVDGVALDGNIFTMPAKNVDVRPIVDQRPRFAVTIDENIENGSITATPNTNILGGTQITLNITPETGYSLYLLSATDEHGQQIAVDCNSFTMPESNVNVTATFMKSVTVNEGTATSQKSPAYTCGLNLASISQFIIPASQLTSIEPGGRINRIMFHVNPGRNLPVAASYEKSYDGYITETDQETMSGFIDLDDEGTTKFFEGHLITSNGNTELCFDFSTPFIYMGGNLAITFNQTSWGGYDYTILDFLGTAKDQEHGAIAWCKDVNESEHHEELAFAPMTTLFYTQGEAPECTVNMHSNGVMTQRTLTYGQLLPGCDNIPQGLSFCGWTATDIETYTENAPSYVTKASNVTDVYAVFKYVENVTELFGTIKDGPDAGSPDLSVGDQLVIANGRNGKILCQRSKSSDNHFGKSNVSISWGIIDPIPSDAVIFTVSGEHGNWKFNFYDKFDGQQTLSDDSEGNLAPANMCGTSACDTWSYVYDYNFTMYPEDDRLNFIKDSQNGRYIAYDNNLERFNTVATIDAETYQEAEFYLVHSREVSKTYYMTEVITCGEIASASTKNIIIDRNRYAIVTGRLELAAGGLFRNDMATHLEFADGAQFYYTGDATISAQFDKNITGYNGNGTRDNYFLIANPTANTAVINLATNSYDLYTFDPAEPLEWRNQHNNTTLNRETGYLYANSEDVTIQFAGNILSASSTEIGLTFAAAGEGIDFPGFNLIGNPFACNTYVSGYQFYTMENGEFVANDNSATIAPCEGIFVEATATGQSVTLSTTAPEPASLLDITVSQNRGNVIDRAIVNFNGSNNLHKFMMNPNHTNISLAKNGEKFAAVSTSATSSELPVNFKAEKNGIYTISVNTENVDAEYLHLIDNMTGMDVDLLSTPSYTFEAKTSDYASRFKLVFGVKNEASESSDSNFAFMSNGNLVIDNIEGEATLQIVDELGRVISTETVCGSYNKALNLKAGLYIINLNGMTQKIVVE